MTCKCECKDKVQPVRGYCAPTEHQFEPLSWSAPYYTSLPDITILYCRKCGEQRKLEVAP